MPSVAVRPQPLEPKEIFIKPLAEAIPRQQETDADRKGAIVFDALGGGASDHVARKLPGAESRQMICSLNVPIRSRTILC